MPVELPCEQCGEIFLTLPTRQRHIRIKHRTNPVSQESHSSSPSTPPPSATPTTTTPTATKKSTAQKPAAAPPHTTAQKPATASPPATPSTTPKTTSNAAKKTAPSSKTDTNPNASKPTPPPAKVAADFLEEELEHRRTRALWLADELEDDLPTSREHFIAELMITEPLNPDFALLIPTNTVDVSQVQGYYSGMSIKVTPLADAGFRKSVTLLAKNPFTMPDPLTANLEAFEVHLETVCSGLVSKKAISLRNPLLYWRFSLTEEMRRTLVFMALQDAAALDKRIKYNEEMVKCQYEGMVIMHESKLGTWHPELDEVAAALASLGLLGEPVESTEETIKQFSNMTMDEIMESVKGTMEAERKKKKNASTASTPVTRASKR
ncbi:hypothetical protein DFS34DRAFT_690022 [Phlyctochytrium arcticum]|nr:hypothetical protein DFS34DRAFT_690022 [Phlyctochytrium arcticum]